MEPKKYEYIDSLRGIAILLVILVHTGIILNNTVLFFPDLLIKFIANGAYGVHLFFIISALTLTMSYHNRLHEKHKTRNFFIRRFFRIAPMYYFAILYFSIIFPYIQGNFEKIVVGKLITTALFINPYFTNYIHGYVPGGWSISVEFLFYFFVPFLCKKITNFNSSMIFIFVALIISIVYSQLYWKNFTNLLFQLPIFSLGIALYWWENDKSKTLSSSTTLIIAIFIFCFCYKPVPYHFLYSLGFAFIIITLMQKPYKLFSNKLFATIGKVSFSMYIIHFAIILILGSINFNRIISVTNIGTSLLNFIGLYLIAVISTFLISQITYRIIEVPGQNLGKKIIKKLNQQKTIS